MQNRDLLRAYLLNHSEQAFTELVARHINLVYATARRVVGDADLAKDITQNTFIHLANKAGDVRDGDALPGWLYRVTCNLATSAIRSESRRRERENIAMNLAELEKPDSSAWSAVAPLLEEAMHRLNAGEQDAVVLRYFEGKSLRDVGLALNLSDDAAQKRISRALEKMRLHFTRHGVTASVVLLGTLLAANSSQAAPAGLVASVAGGAFAGASGSSGAGVAGSLTKHILAKNGMAALVAGFAAMGVLAWHFHEVDGRVGKSGLSDSGTEPSLLLHDGAYGSAAETLTLEAPLIASVDGSGSQFTLNAIRKAGGETAIVSGEGTVRSNNPADTSPVEYFLDYHIKWQVFSITPAASPDQVTSSKDDFEIRSSATLTPNTPFPLMRMEGKIVTVMTDGNKIILTITRTGEL